MNFDRKHLPSGLFLLFILFLFACGSNDPAPANSQTGTIKTTAQLSVNSCDSVHYHGRLERTVALGVDNYFYVKVNVSAKGAYSFKTDESNGYYFLAEGEFTTTGLQELRFLGKGTPTTAKVDDVVLKFGNATCGQKVTVYEKNYPNPDATVIIVTGEPFMASSYYTYAFNGYGKQLWRVLGGSSTPAVSGDIAYMIGSDDEVYARNILTGTTIWKTSMSLSLQDGPVTIDGDNLYVTGNGKLMSIARATGTINWTYTFGAINYSMWAPSVSNGKVFASYDKNFYCLDLAGNLIWTYPMTNSIRSNPAIYNGVVYVGNDGGTLTAINISDKTTRWTSIIGMTGEESPTIDNGKVYVQGATKVFCLDAMTGNSIWTYSIESGTADWSSPTVANGIVYVAGFGKGVIALDATTGAKLWNNNSAAETADNPPTVLNSLLVEGGPNGLSAINAITGATIWNIAPFVAGSSTTPITFYTSAAIYNREKGEIAYPSTSGHKQ
jgi:outer membrane protein assembly factor BamB